MGQRAPTLQEFGKDYMNHRIVEVPEVTPNLRSVGTNELLKIINHRRGAKEKIW